MAVYIKERAVKRNKVHGKRWKERESDMEKESMRRGEKERVRDRMSE